MSLILHVPKRLLPLMACHRTFKVAYGGRGGAKSWSFARMLVIKAYTEINHKILCTREFQSSIADSVYAVIKSQIIALGLLPWFKITEDAITCPMTNAQFIFNRGLRRNINEIKSLEGITITWVEEAQATSENSWLVLIPTVLRTPNAEIWVSFNPQEAEDPTYKRFVTNPPPNSMVIKLNWDDNPWFPAGLEEERKHMLRVDPDAYDWVWEGNTRHVSEATIFRNRFIIEEFETPPEVRRFLFGADWGFSTDPTALMRCWRSDDERILHIDQEAHGYKVELDDIPALFAGGKSNKSEMEWLGIEGARDWPIKADSARPETISYVRGKGFNIAAAKKWQGSVEDGIEYLKSYQMIKIHPRCKAMGQEARLYSYKVDKQTNDILPVIEDRHNHCWDAIRYAHDGYITASGALGTWSRLARGTRK